MRIVLPIFWNDDTDVVLEDLGIATKDLHHKETKDCIFYNIDALFPYIQDEINCTEIISGSKSVICPLCIDIVDKLICNCL